jgi:hypothetical protein
MHYLTYGAGEGRDPNGYFSSTGYLAANPDVAASGTNPLLHYMTDGWKEGRSPSDSFQPGEDLPAHHGLDGMPGDPLADALLHPL